MTQLTRISYYISLLYLALLLYFQRVDNLVTPSQANCV